MAANLPQIRETNMVLIAFRRGFSGFMASMLLLGLTLPLQAKEFIKGERPQQRGYSQAVITEGGKIVWLAGVLAVVDDSGTIAFVTDSWRNETAPPQAAAVS